MVPNMGGGADPGGNAATMHTTCRSPGRPTANRRARNQITRALISGVLGLMTLTGCSRSTEPPQSTASSTPGSSTTISGTQTTTPSGTDSTAPTGTGSAPSKTRPTTIPGTDPPPPQPSPGRPPTTPSTYPEQPPPNPPGDCSIPNSLRGVDVTTVSSRQVIALTFDAGANADAVDAILAELSRTGTPATFFLTGRWAQNYPAQARRIAGAYPIGNHSMTHPDFTTLTDAQARAQLDDARAAIMAATGQDPRPYVRFPSGAVNAHAIAVVNDRCYVPFRWTTDTLGWQGTSGGRTAAFVTARVVQQARPGGIVLMHVGSNPDDGTTLDAAALPQVIAGLRAKGYGFVTLGELLSPAP